MWKLTNQMAWNKKSKIEYRFIGFYVMMQAKIFSTDDCETLKTDMLEDEFGNELGVYYFHN